MAILLTYRRTSRLSLRIVKNGDVHVSAPFGISQGEVDAFVAQHREWIARAREAAAERQRRRAAFFGRLPLATRAQQDAALLRLQSLVGPMVERHARAMHVSPSVVSFKPMISRWGYCRLRDRSVCISTYVLLLPDWCVEHIVVHELCHLLEPSHNSRFHALMDTFFPMWREARRETRRVSKGVA